MNMANAYSLKCRIDNELKQLKPQLDVEISNWADNVDTYRCYDPQSVGALVHIIVSQGDAPIGQRAPYSFVSMFLADCGLEYLSVYNNYVSHPSAFQGSGDTNQFWIFLWYTLDGGT